MNISTISGYGNIFESQAVNSAKDCYNPSSPSTQAYTAKGDSVSISPGARQKYLESTQVPVDIQAGSKPLDPDNMKVGLFGEADLSSVDAVYVPQGILDAMPSMDDYRRAYGWFDFSSGGKSAIGKEPGAMEQLLNNQENISGLWAKYKETLTDYGLDYKDNAAMNDLLKDKELRNRVERDFESRI